MNTLVIMKFIRKKPRWIKWLVVGLCLLLVVFFIVNKSFVRIHRNIKVECRYVAYACGDCYPKYVVEYVSSSILKKSLIDKNIYLEFESNQEDEKLDNKIGQYATCYRIILFGDLEYDPFKKYGYTLKVAKYILKKRKDCFPED